MTPVPHPEHRADRRYGLALPITLEGEEGQTLDLSAHGILLETSVRPEVGARVSLALHYRAGSSDCRLTCEGEVVRVEPHGATCNIAVRLDRPLFR